MVCLGFLERAHKSLLDTRSARTDDMLNAPETRVYQRAIGRLMYLMVGTRPDIAYAVTKHLLNLHLAHLFVTDWESYASWFSIPNVRQDYHPSGSPIHFLPHRLFWRITHGLCHYSQIYWCLHLLLRWCSHFMALQTPRFSCTQLEFISGTEAARELAWLSTTSTFLHLGP